MENNYQKLNLEELNLEELNTFIENINSKIQNYFQLRNNFKKQQENLLNDIYINLIPPSKKQCLNKILSSKNNQDNQTHTNKSLSTSTSTPTHTPTHTPTSTPTHTLTQTSTPTTTLYNDKDLSVDINITSSTPKPIENDDEDLTISSSTLKYYNEFNTAPTPKSNYNDDFNSKNDKNDKNDKDKDKDINIDDEKDDTDTDTDTDTDDSYSETDNYI